VRWTGCASLLASLLGVALFAHFYLALPTGLKLLFLMPGLVALHVVVVRNGGWRLIGPHCYFDLIRMARKGRTILFRVLFLLALLAGIWYTYEQHQAGDDRAGLWARNIARDLRGEPMEWNLRNELARFNTECVYTWFLLQNLTILVLGPAYFGGAIAEERERGTLEILFSSALYDREIVLGKLVARSLHLGLFLLAGLPVYSLMLVWGGIDMDVLLTNWLSTMLLLLATGSVCVMFSTMPASSTACVIVSYALVLPFGFCCLGVWHESWRAGTGSVGMVATAVGAGVITLFALFITIQALRPKEWPVLRADDFPLKYVWGPGAVDPELAVAPLPPFASTADLEKLRPPLPPVHDDALYWKERHTGARSLLECPEWLLPALTLLSGPILLLFIATVTELRQAEGQSMPDTLRIFAHNFGPWLRGLYGFALLCYTIGVAVRAAGSVVRERQMHTLDMLLTIPVERRDILWAKSRGVIVKGWPWLVVLAGDVFVGLVVSAYSPLSVIFLLLCPCPLIVFVCGVGMLISVGARTTLQANLVMACVLLALAVSLGVTRPGLFLGFNSLTQSWWEPWSEAGYDLFAFGVSALGFGLTAAIAWGLARVRFERLGR
jgi:ABC-type transport system involved in multi-copper enzyme maturation permease subunit